MLRTHVIHKLISFMVIMVPIMLFGGGVAIAASSQSSPSSCTLSGGTFFGFPTWYKYLQGQVENVSPESNINSSGGGSSSTVTNCVPQFDSVADIWLVVAAVIDMLLYLAGMGAVFMVIYGGVRYTTSNGSPEATTQARNTILYALIGLLIAISASFLITFVATTLGGAA